MNDRRRFCPWLALVWIVFALVVHWLVLSLFGVWP